MTTDDKLRRLSGHAVALSMALALGSCALVQVNSAPWFGIGLGLLIAATVSWAVGVSIMWDVLSRPDDGGGA